MLLISAGWNDNGQLGRYVDFEEEDGELPAGAVDVHSNAIKSIASGFNHSVVVFDNAKVVGWGSNHSNQIGFPERISYPSPTAIAFFNNIYIQQVACSSNSTTYLTENGEVYYSTRFNPKNQPIQKLNISEPIIKCCNTYEFPCMISQSGKIYEISKNNVIKEYAINDEKIVDASSGKTFMVAITEQGKAYGLGSICNNSTNFELIESLKSHKIRSVTANINHCFVIDYDAHVYAWGSGKDGQLGLGENLTQLSEFTKIESFKNVIEISTSLSTTCFITNKHKLFACGSYGGYLVNSSPEKVFTPVDVTKTVYGPAHSISCGEHHTIAFVEGLLKYQERDLDPELILLRDRLRQMLEQEELLKKKADEENRLLQARLDEEKEMKKKAEEESELMRLRQEEEEKERRRRQKEEERLRKEQEEERLRREAEALMAKIREAEALQSQIQERNMTIQNNETQIGELQSQNNAANTRIEELQKEMEELKELAAKSKCCLLI